jgi:hypothetical protein
MLAGGQRVKVRVQHPQVKPRKDRQGWPWVFRYWHDEVQPDGTLKALRKYQAVGPSKGEDAITKKQAEVERDKFLAKLNAPTVDAAVQQVAATGVALFGAVAKMYEEGYLRPNGPNLHANAGKGSLLPSSVHRPDGANCVSTNSSPKRWRTGYTPPSIRGGPCTACAQS